MYAPSETLGRLLNAPGSAARRPGGVLPGFSLSLGYTLLYLSLIVLMPLAAVLLKTTTMTLDAFWHAVSAPSFR